MNRSQKSGIFYEGTKVEQETGMMGIIPVPV